MRVSPYPVLLAITLIQVCLLLLLLLVSLDSGLVQGRKAEFDSGYARNWEKNTNTTNSQPLASVLGLTPAEFAHLAHDNATNAENSATLCAVIAIALGVLAILQLWLVGDVRRELKKLQPTLPKNDS